MSNNKLTEREIQEFLKKAYFGDESIIGILEKQPEYRDIIKDIRMKKL